MSQTFSLVCHETRQMLWIGQGRSEVMTVLYSGDTETMEKLKRFLNATRGKPLMFVCDDTSDGRENEYDEFEDTNGISGKPECHAS